MKELELNDYDYDYRFDLQDGIVLGYLKRDRWGSCEFHFADDNSDKILYGDTPISIKNALENFVINALHAKLLEL